MMNTALAMRWPAIAMFALLSIAGCKKRVDESTEPAFKALPVPEKTAENDWPLYEVPAEGFALALPADWEHIEINPQTLDDLVSKATDKYPGLRGMADSIRQEVKAGIKLYGFDNETATTGRGTSVNVGKFALPAGGTLDALVEQNARQIPNRFKVTGPMKRERKTTLHADGERLQYRVQLNGPNGRPINLVLTQYFFVTDAHFFVVTYKSSDEKSEKNPHLATAICESFRLINK
jgi:hypothetical protein